MKHKQAAAAATAVELSSPPASYDASVHTGVPTSVTAAGAAAPSAPPVESNLVGSAYDAKFGVWQRVDSAKSKDECKAMAYARWAYSSLSTCHIFRQALREQGVTMEWKRTMAVRWGSRENSMYFILFVELLTSAFMQANNGSMLTQLTAQPRNTLTAMHAGPDARVDKNLKNFFTCGCIIKLLYCQPMRKLASNPEMGAELFEKECRVHLEMVLEAVEDEVNGEQLRGDLWNKGFGLLVEKMEVDIGRASKKRKTDVVPNQGFVAGPQVEEWPASGRRDRLFKTTLCGVADAIQRNLLGTAKLAETMCRWKPEHIETAALNHTLPVESMFSHMRRLESESKQTRCALMEAVLFLKVYGNMDLRSPPSFLPAHLTTPEGMRSEGRESEARYGSRQERGAAHMVKARAEAEAADIRVQTRAAATGYRKALAQETEGAVVYVCLDGVNLSTRTLLPGEALTPFILMQMGPFLGEWLTEVKLNNKALKWTDVRIKSQLVLVNSKAKGADLLVKLRAQEEFHCKGDPSKSLFRNEDGQIALTTGARADRLLKLLIYVTCEAVSPCEDDDSGENVPCDPVTSAKIRAAWAAPPSSAVGGVAGAPGSSGGGAGRGAGGRATGASAAAAPKAKKKVNPPPPPPPPPAPPPDPPEEVEEDTRLARLLLAASGAGISTTAHGVVSSPEEDPCSEYRGPEFWKG